MKLSREDVEMFSTMEIEDQHQLEMLAENAPRLARELLEAWELLKEALRADHRNTSCYDAVQIQKRIEKYLEGKDD